MSREEANENGALARRRIAMLPAIESKLGEDMKPTMLSAAYKVVKDLAVAEQVVADYASKYVRDEVRLAYWAKDIQNLAKNAVRERVRRAARTDAVVSVAVDDEPGSDWRVDVDSGGSSKFVLYQLLMRRTRGDGGNRKENAMISKLAAKHAASVVPDAADVIEAVQSRSAGPARTRTPTASFTPGSQWIGSTRLGVDIGTGELLETLFMLTDLDAFYLDYRRCGDLRAGVVDREPDAVVWLECACSARIVRRFDRRTENRTRRTT